MLKLKCLNLALKCWNKKTFGDVHSYISEAHSSLKEVKDEIANFGFAEVRFKDNVDAQCALDLDLDIRDFMLRDHCRVKWLRKGDRFLSCVGVV